jgi:stage V sporulation protein G
MVVTEVKIKLVPRTDDKLLAFASITLDRSFVVRDIKIIQGTRALFVAMPSRKITDRCAKCGSKNHLQALFCNHCGTRLVAKRLRPDDRGRAKLHADIAHPINVRCRREIQQAILNGYAEELARSQKPGYVPANFEEDFDAGPEYDDVPNSTGITPIGGSPAVDGAPESESADNAPPQNT